MAVGEVMQMEGMHAAAAARAGKELARAKKMRARDAKKDVESLGFGILLRKTIGAIVLWKNTTRGRSGRRRSHASLELGASIPRSFAGKHAARK